MLCLTLFWLAWALFIDLATSLATSLSFYGCSWALPVSSAFCLKLSVLVWVLAVDLDIALSTSLGLLGLLWACLCFLGFTGLFWFSKLLWASLGSSYSSSHSSSYNSSYISSYIFSYSSNCISGLLLDFLGFSVLFWAALFFWYV